MNIKRSLFISSLSLLFPSLLQAQALLDSTQSTPIAPINAPIYADNAVQEDNAQVTDTSVSNADTSNTEISGDEISSVQDSTNTLQDSSQAQVVVADTAAVSQQAYETFQPSVDTIQASVIQNTMQPLTFTPTDTIQEIGWDYRQNPSESKASKKDEGPKRLWFGVTIGGFYNDLYDTHFGLKDIQQGQDYNISVKGSDDILHNFWGFGYTAGVSGMFMFNPSFNLRSGVSVTRREGTGKSNLSAILSWDDESKADEKSDMEIEYTLKQTNIDVPLLARYSIPNAIYVEAGPTASFSVYSKNKTTITDVFGTQTYRKHGGLKLCELDLAAGIGIMRPIGGTMIDFDIRFVLGLTRLSDGNDSPKSMQGQFNITYWFL